MAEVQYVQCPFCGWVRPRRYYLPSLRKKAEHHFPKEFKFGKVDPSIIHVLQTRLLEGKGRGSKDARIEFVSGLKLNELPPEFKEDIRKQCQRIMELVG